MNKPIVLHTHRRFFARTETFIYNTIANLKELFPLCYARRYINLDQFPIEKEKLLQPSVSDPEWMQWLYQYFFTATSVNLFLPSLLKKYPVKLIHAHFGPQGYAALKLKQQCRAPLCTTFYGYDVSQRGQDKKWLERYGELFRQGDLFLVEGEFMKNSLLKLGCPESKIQIQRIAIPLEKIAFCRRTPKGRGKKARIFFAGSFVEKKGLIYALQAIDLVRKTNQNFTFDIIGDGVLRASLESYIREHDLGHLVKLHGYLSYETYLTCMREADIFLHPSVTAADGDSEGGAPTVILEAQAMGIPVVSSYHADIPNIVIPGQSALLSREKDVKELAVNILSLLEDQSQWAKMGEAGREFVYTSHSIQKEIPLLEEKYTRLIEER